MNPEEMASEVALWDAIEKWSTTTFAGEIKMQAVAEVNRIIRARIDREKEKIIQALQKLPGSNGRRAEQIVRSV